MDFGRQNTPGFDSDCFTKFDSDWNQSREQARKRFDEFRKDAENSRRKMFDNNNTQWPNMPAFTERPFPSMDRAASPRWATTDVPLKTHSDRGYEDNASETSSVGNNSSASLHRSSSSSSTASSSSGSTKHQQPRVHKIPIVVEGQSQKASSTANNSPNGRSSGYVSDIARDADHLSSSPDCRGRHSTSPRVSRTQSPVCNGEGSREIPVLVEGMPKVKSAMGMGQSARPKPTRGSEEPNTGNRSGPHVTRINLNSQERDESSSPKPPPVKPDPMQMIDDVVNEVAKYEKEINEFSGDSSDKQYRYLDEMLTRCMIKLDNVETDGQPEIRAARKEAVNMVHRCVGVLEKRSGMKNGESNSETENTDHHQNNLRHIEENSESLAHTTSTAHHCDASVESPPPPTLVGTETAV